jgi:hypothetical protein
MNTVKDLLKPIVEHFKQVTSLCYVEDEEKIVKMINEYFSSDCEHRSYGSEKFFMIWPIHGIDINQYIMFSDIRYEKSGWSITFMIDGFHMISISLDCDSIYLSSHLDVFCHKIGKNFWQLTETDINIFQLEFSMVDNVALVC